MRNGMAHPDSFGARSRLTVGERDVEALPPRRAPGALRRAAPALHAPDPARERPPQRGRGHGHGRRRRSGRGLGRRRGAVAGDLVHPGPRPAPGLHRRSRDRRPRGDAQRDEPTSAATPRGSTRCFRRSSSSTTPSRSTSSRRRSRSGATRSSSSSATASATRSCAGAKAASSTSRSSRRRPESCTR